MRRRSGSVPEHKVNCVLVGDVAVGKTSLIVSYTTNGYPTEYIPTAFDNFDELDRIRPLCYHNADVFLLCYSMVRPSTFRNATDSWVPEIRRHCPEAPMVLVGTQLDLREDVQVLVQLARNQERPMGTEECPGLIQKNLKEVFDQAILASIQPAENIQQKPSLRKKTPDKIKSLSETWWKKLSCVVVAGECVGREFD
uniref:Ras homolog family member U n=1 Tax=Hucho hucho TaxID=62062 RepID=A0A4W5RXS9_9TELE